MNGAIKTTKIIFISASLCLCGLFFAACSELEKPKPEPFYAETAPPPKKEFRWSNGKTPKSFDPALAAAAPETDVVRALYEGLTDTDPKTLAAVPAIALNWKSSGDFKTWTFNLRRDAKWSNGERITAKDFVRSWKRLSEMGEQVSHPELLQNIVGLKVPGKEVAPAGEADKLDILPKKLPSENLPFLLNQANSNSAKAAPKASESNTNTAQKTKEEKPVEKPFGIEATDNFTLKISLIKPDKDFPALVAHPIFRPIYGDGADFETGRLNAGIITSGAFRIFSIGQDGITLDRAEHYWNADAIELERVRFVPTESPEKALAAYRAGEVDAITNVEFEPLALKLLMPYEDFQRTTYGAINYYEFNRQKPPFDDRRVREALTIAIERERITGDEMDGASQPAFGFLPFADEKIKIVEDAQKARNLLAETGFPNGENFPVVKLLVNRNNLQQRIARSVAVMWKQNLNIETEVVVKDAEQLKNAGTSEDYSLIRRGAVLPTVDELTNMSAIIAAENKFPVETKENTPKQAGENFPSNRNSNTSESVTNTQQPKKESETGQITDENESLEAPAENETILTERQAIDDLPAIPLYFPTSYFLVKPYVQGFDINNLDAPSLKDVKIDNNWQPRKTKGES